MPVNGSGLLDSDLYRYTSTLADTEGVPLANRFMCLINGPPLSDAGSSASGMDSGGLGSGATNGWLEMQVIAVDCPSFSFDLTTQDLNGYMRFVAKARNDNDITMTFLDSCDLKIRRYFYRWMQLAAEINESGSKRKYMSEICAKSFIIAPLNNRGEASYGDIFKYVMPTQIQDITYNYQQAGEVVKTIVNFKFMLHNMCNLDNLTDAKNHAIQKHT
jgi:hypothetical protein